MKFKNSEKEIERFMNNVNHNIQRSLSNFKVTAIQQHQQPQVYFDLGITCLQHEAYNAAIRAFDSVIELTPKDDQAYVNRGYCYLMLGNQNAINNYTKAIELNPLNSFGYSRRGISNFVKGDYPQCYDDLNKAIHLDVIHKEDHDHFKEAINEIHETLYSTQTIEVLPKQSEPVNPDDDIEDPNVTNTPNAETQYMVQSLSNLLQQIAQSERNENSDSPTRRPLKECSLF